MKYKKKPVVIEAFEFDYKTWLNEIVTNRSSATYPMIGMTPDTTNSPVITTLEGNMKVSDGDFIIKGVQGEYYPCKPDIFHKTYEVAE